MEMNENQQAFRRNEFMVKLNKIISPIFEKLEIPLVAAFLIAIILKITSEVNINIFMIIISLTFAISYFLKAFEPLQEFAFGGLANVMHKLSYISMSVSIIGILFFLQNFHGPNQMLIIGGGTLIITLISILVMQMKMPELKIFSMSIKIRIIVILFLVALIYFIPTSDFVELGLIKSKNIIQP